MTFISSGTTHSFLSEETLRFLYSGIVEPHFDCYCSVWGCCGASEIGQLEKMQNRAGRIVTGNKFDTPDLPLVKQLGLKTIGELIDSEANTMVFKSSLLAQQYLGYAIFLQERMSQLASVNLRNTFADLRLPRGNS